MDYKEFLSKAAESLGYTLEDIFEPNRIYDQFSFVQSLDEVYKYESKTKLPELK